MSFIISLFYQNIITKAMPSTNLFFRPAAKKSTPVYDVDWNCGIYNPMLAIPMDKIERLLSVPPTLLNICLFIWLR